MLLLALAVAAAGARAEPPTRIVVISSPTTEPGMLKRLRAELVGLGFLVVQIESSDDDGTPDSLAEAAQEQEALAAIRVVSIRTGVTVWIADLVTGKTVFRTLAGSGSDVSGEVVALRAVELLRASLMELTLWRENAELPGPALRALVPPAPSPRTTAVPTRLRLALGPAMLADAETGRAVHAMVGARYEALEYISLRAFVLAPVLAASVERPEGKARLYTGLVGLGIDADVLPPSSSLRIRLGTSAALAYLRVSGTASGAYAARAQALWTGAAMLQSCASYRVTPKLAVALDLFAGLSAPRPVIYFADRRVAAWGRPFVGASLGIELGVP